jgi:hypothetical protein
MIDVRGRTSEFSEDRMGPTSGLFVGDGGLGMKYGCENLGS